MFVPSRNRQRFSLLCLEEGESLLEDHTIQCCPPQNEHEFFRKTSSLKEGKFFKGRLKVCTYSLVFEPENIEQPLMRIAYRDINIISPYSENEDYFSVNTSKVQEMLKNGMHHPYKFRNLIDTNTKSLNLNNKQYMNSGFNNTNYRLPRKLSQSSSSYQSINNSNNIRDLFTTRFDANNNINANTNSYSSLQSQPSTFDHRGTYLFQLSFASRYTLLNLLGYLCKLSKTSIDKKDIELERLVQEREEAVQFDSSRFKDLRENPQLGQAVSASQILPLVVNPGRIMITDQRLYFQPFASIWGELVSSYELKNICRVLKRSHDLGDIALLIFFFPGTVLHGQHLFNTDWKLYTRTQITEKTRSETESAANSTLALLFTFHNQHDRDIIYELTRSLPATRHLAHEPSLSSASSLWINGQLSNFDYLMFLNYQSGRSFNDLSRYPVFPWIIADYTSSILDLTQPDTFRNLEKPIGALTSSRLEHFKQRLNEMKQDSSSTPYFLYGTHYSTPGYVLYFLVRRAPQYMLKLHHGKFDSADRLFSSIKSTWDGVLKSTTDVKELIPEFYQYPPNTDFLLTSPELSGILGTTVTGKDVADVELPPWAKNASDFIIKCREALECEYVSSRLHQWIDLIFGANQNGEKALLANNLFFYLTYEGSVDFKKIRDRVEARALLTQIREFGQTPKQLFTSPHPMRTKLSPIPPSSKTATTLWSYKNKSFPNDNNKYINKESVRQRKSSSNIHRSHSNTIPENALSHVLSSTFSNSNYTHKNTNTPLYKGNAYNNSTISNAYDNTDNLYSNTNDNNNSAVSFLSNLWSTVSDTLSDTLAGITQDNPKNLTIEKENRREQEQNKLYNNSIFNQNQESHIVRKDAKILNLSNPIRSSHYCKNESNQFHSIMNKLSMSTSNRPINNTSLSPNNSTSKSLHQKWGDFSLLSQKTLLSPHREFITDLCFSQTITQNHIYSISKDGHLKIFNASSTKQHLSLHRSVKISDLSLSCLCLARNDDNNETVMIGSWDNCLYLYIISYGRIVKANTCHSDAVSALSFSDSSNQLISGSWDSTVKLWSYQNSGLEFLTDYSDHETEISSVAISPEGQIAITGDVDGEIYLWDLRKGKKIGCIRSDYKHSGSIISLNFIPHTTSNSSSQLRYLSAGDDGVVKFWEYRSARPLTVFDTNETLVSVQTDGEQVVTASKSRLRIWTMSGQEICSLPQSESDDISCLAVSDNGKYIATGYNALSDNIAIWSQPANLTT